MNTAPVYFNEFDPVAAAWLRQLIRDGLLPQGEVDERNIKEVTPADLKGFTHCHFFAGIGGWPLALEQAGWPNDRPVWTGSCPCQPYSSAGKQLGDADPRNLWPDFYRLIRECRPLAVIGEQVEGAIRKGWLDRVCADLEGAGYAVGSVVLGAHSAGAPHIRQRLYWLADAGSRGRSEGRGIAGGADRAGVRRGEPDADRELRGVGNSQSGGALPAEQRGLLRGPECSGPDGVMGHTRAPRLSAPEPEGVGRTGRREEGRATAEPSSALGHWSAFDLIPCRDGKARRVEPGAFPLAHGVPGRVGLLRGYGNAIVPQVAAAFVRAFLDTEAEGGVR